MASEPDGQAAAEELDAAQEIDFATLGMFIIGTLFSLVCATSLQMSLLLPQRQRSIAPQPLARLPYIAMAAQITYLHIIPHVVDLFRSSLELSHRKLVCSAGSLA